MRILNLTLQVRLGCLPEERSKPQEVRVSLDLRFAEVPVGTTSDDLHDTICYAQISHALKSHVEDKEFQLVEKLAQDFYGIVERMVEGRAEISLIAHKVKPPVSGLLGGVEYRIGNFT